MLNQHLPNSAKRSKAWPAAKHLVWMASPQTSSSAVETPYCSLFTMFFASVGEKERCRKTWEMPRIRLRWLGHMCGMEDGRIPKDILYCQLASGKRTVGCPQLRYKDVCKRDMKALDINTESWEDAAADGNKWRCVLHKQLKSGEEKIQTSADEKRAKRKACIATATPTSHTCKKCGRDCLSRIGLISAQLALSLRLDDLFQTGAKSIMDFHWRRPTIMVVRSHLYLFTLMISTQVLTLIIMHCRISWLSIHGTLLFCETIRIPKHIE